MLLCITQNQLSYSDDFFHADVVEITNEIEELVPLRSNILIMDFIDLSDTITPFGKYLAEKISIELAQRPETKVVDRSNISFIMQEQKLQLSELMDSTSVVAVGELVGANYIIHGQITEFRSFLELQIKVVSVLSSTVAGGTTYKLNKTSEAASLVGTIVMTEKEIQAQLEEYRQGILADIEAEKNRRVAAIKVEEQELRAEISRLEEEIRDKSQLLATLQDKKNELSSYNDQIEAIRQELIVRNNLVESSIMAGMRFHEVREILNESSFGIKIQSGPWQNVFGSSYYYTSHHGNYLIVWSDNDISDTVVIGCHNLVTGRSFRRLAE